MCDACHDHVAEGDPGCTSKWNENEMLEFTPCERRPNGGLSCQWVASPGTGGLVVELMDTRL